MTVRRATIISYWTAKQSQASEVVGASGLHRGNCQGLNTAGGMAGHSMHSRQACMEATVHAPGLLTAMSPTSGPLYPAALSTCVTFYQVEKCLEAGLEAAMWNSTTSEQQRKNVSASTLHICLLLHGSAWPRMAGMTSKQCPFGQKA